MRLIDCATMILEEFDEGETPEYAILSHTWEDGEINFRAMQQLESIRDQPGFRKISNACRLALEQNLKYVWVDTCCIDKSSSAELQEAINSMWRWYSRADVCFVLMSDLPSDMPYLTDGDFFGFRASHKDPFVEWTDPMLERKNRYEKRQIFLGARWFKRGWCLQELIAPKKQLFYSLPPNGGECKLVGDKNQLLLTISIATKVDTAILARDVPLHYRSIAQRMSWAAGRKTRRIEDQAYSLLGIFGINMPMLYGEGQRAFTRLQEEVMKTTSDHSIFAWECGHGGTSGQLLANSPDDFAKANRIVPLRKSSPFEMTNGGLRIALRTVTAELSNVPEDLAVLECWDEYLKYTFALRLLQSSGGVGKERQLVTLRPLRAPDMVAPKRLASIEDTSTGFAEKHQLLIARTRETRRSRIRFTLRLDKRFARSAHVYDDDMYPSREAWKSSTDERGIVLFETITVNKPLERRGLMIEYPSGRCVSLVFGFDRIPPDHEDGVLLPGVWLQLHNGPQSMSDMITWVPVHQHGRDHPCRIPSVEGCPDLPSSACLYIPPEGEQLNAAIEQAIKVDEKVFTVHSSIVQEPNEFLTHPFTASEARRRGEIAIDSPSLERRRPCRQHRHKLRLRQGTPLTINTSICTRTTANAAILEDSVTPKQSSSERTMQACFNSNTDATLGAAQA